MRLNCVPCTRGMGVPKVSPIIAICEEYNTVKERCEKSVHLKINLDKKPKT